MEFYVNNQAFESVDAEMLYGLCICYFKPKRYCEIGSGWSTMCALTAARRNVADGHPIVLLRPSSPFPDDFLQKMAADPLLELSVEKVQDVSMDRFTSLGDGDILFIDSSHALRAGSDVQREFLTTSCGSRPGSWSTCTTSSCRRKTRSPGCSRSTGSGTSSTCCRRS